MLVSYSNTSIRIEESDRNVEIYHRMGAGKLGNNVVRFRASFRTKSATYLRFLTIFRPENLSDADQKLLVALILVGLCGRLVRKDK